MIVRSRYDYIQCLDYAYDIIDQYEWLDHAGELRDSEIQESRQYIESVTTMF